MTASDSPRGLLSSLRVLGDNLLAGAQERVELASLELQEEKFRLVQTLIWMSGAIFAVAMTLAFASLTLVYLFWESARLTVLAALTAGYATGAIATVVGFRRYLAHQPRPFSATSDELRQDRACIPPEN